MPEFPELPPRTFIPHEARAFKLLGAGDRTFEWSVDRRFGRSKSSRLSNLLTAVKAYQNRQATATRDEKVELLKTIERCIVLWVQTDPKEVEDRGTMLAELLGDTRDALAALGEQIMPGNLHAMIESANNQNPVEHGVPVNLWRKSYMATKAGSSLGGLGGTAASNMGGGGIVGVLGGTGLFAMGAATGVGLMVGGIVITVGTSVAAGRSAYTTHQHVKGLKTLERNAGQHTHCVGLMGNPADAEAHQEIVDVVLPYVINKKSNKRWRKGMAAIPVIGLAETVRAIGQKARKKINGTLGVARAAHAMTLAEHLITHNCELTRLILEELFSVEEAQWLRYQDYAAVAGIVQEKFKST